ncbi:hypothetical protein [Nocardia sp. NPDC051570]|uniref:hypothetical protein n=1 Tax=Nocardia sp. NPDC051570 TaxID=3364324 RepID=UPI00379FA837
MRCRGLGGHRAAVTEVVQLLRDSPYRLVSRLAGRPADAEDLPCSACAVQNTRT